MTRLEAMVMLRTSFLTLLATALPLLLAPKNGVAQASFSGTTQVYISNLGGTDSVAVDTSGNVFATDCSNNAIKEVYASTGTIRSIAIYPGTTCPHAVALDRFNNLYVASTHSDFITELLAANNYTAFSKYGTGFNNAYSIAVDLRGDVFVADSLNSRLVEFVATGGQINNGSAQIVWKNPAWFGMITGVAVDSFGNIFVADPQGGAVKELQAIGGTIPAAPNVIAIGNSWQTPNGVALDGQNNLYVSESPGPHPADLKEATAGITTEL